MHNHRKYHWRYMKANMTEQTRSHRKYHHPPSKKSSHFYGLRLCIAPPMLQSWLMTHLPATALADTSEVVKHKFFMSETLQFYLRPPRMDCWWTQDLRECDFIVKILLNGRGGT